MRARFFSNAQLAEKLEYGDLHPEDCRLDAVVLVAINRVRHLDV